MKADETEQSCTGRLQKIHVKSLQQQHMEDKL